MQHFRMLSEMVIGSGSGYLLEVTHRNMYYYPLYCCCFFETTAELYVHVCDAVICIYKYVTSLRVPVVTCGA